MTLSPRLRTTLLLAIAGAGLGATAWQMMGERDAAGAAVASPPRVRAAASGAARTPPARPAASSAQASPAGSSDLLLGGAAASAPAPLPASALATLDTRLVQQRVGAADAARDAFATRSWTVPPPPPPPAPPAPPPPPPPPPEAPPLPFKYMGKLDESASRTLWYLMQGERLVVVATGETIDSTYRIDGFEAGQLRFTYLPLKQRQSLAIGGTP